MANRLVLPVIMITNLRLVSPAFSQGFKLLTMVRHPFGVQPAFNRGTPITNYVINASPEPSRPEAVVIPGQTEINIKEQPVPMPDSRPRSGTPDNWPTSSAASIRRPEIVRNMAVTGDGNVALANSLVNEVGLVEIK